MADNPGEPDDRFSSLGATLSDVQPPENNLTIDIAILIQSTLLACIASLIVHYMKIQGEEHGETASSRRQDIAPTPHECERLIKHGYGQGITSFSEFYPFYLCEHSGTRTKLFHFIGTFNAAVFLLMFLRHRLNPKIIVFGFVQAYSFAWFSHFFLELNKPATFVYPTYSFASDWIMFKDLLVGSLTMW
eukprot:maker-scaffold1123_size61443-snap-gene-0.25 protein:Tk01079 transcript:maker-scaffold1123_size61443-snap-gene-0.25-mRNA-1 annotation:"membrane protein"